VYIYTYNMDLWYWNHA